MKTPFTNPLSRISLPVAALLITHVVATAPDKPVTLTDAFKDHFLVGVAVNRSMVTGAAWRRGNI